MATLVDTNILLRLLQPRHPHYPVASAAISELRKQKTDLCIAPQNLVEVWVVATRPIANNGLGMSPLRIAGELQALHVLFRLLEGNGGIIRTWEKLVGTYQICGKLAHDAHLVAVMQAHGVTDILTFNVADFERFPEITALDPATV